MRKKPRKSFPLVKGTSRKYDGLHVDVRITDVQNANDWRWIEHEVITLGGRKVVAMIEVYKDPLGAEIEHAIPVTSSIYQHMKHVIAEYLAGKANQRLIGKMLMEKRRIPPEVANSKLPKVRFRCRAAAILRLAKAKGLELTMGSHSLHYRSGFPMDHPPEDFMTIWNKDHVFRSLARRSRHCTDWGMVMTKTIEIQKGTMMQLLKPWRRALAERKISTDVALTIADLPKGQQQELLNDRRFWVSSGMKVKNWKDIRYCRERIKTFGRTPAREIANPRLSDIPKDLSPEWSMAIHSLGAAGGVVPTSWRTIRQLVKDLHDQDSAAYKFVYRHDVERPVWIIDKPLPALRDIGQVSIRHFTERAHWVDEGREMNHCIGMYAGVQGLFCHLERGEDKASLYVGCGGEFQCYGPCNQPNPLSRDVVDHWIPTLRDWTKPDCFKLTEVAQPERELVAYD